MPIIHPDTSEIPSNDPVEPGVYAGKIISVDTKISNAGNQMIVPKVEFNAGGQRRVRNDYVVVTGKGAFKFDQLLRATGFEGVADALRDGSGSSFDTDELIGVEVNVQIEADTYNGELRDKVAGYLKA
jgi:hypothetical protein